MNLQLTTVNESSRLNPLASSAFSRRQFLKRSSLAVAGAAVLSDFPVVITSHAEMLALRRAIVDSPFQAGLHRARVFTEVFQKNEAKPWVVRKAMALRQYFETVPLYLREHDRIAGAISEQPGAMPVMVELGIGENDVIRLVERMRDEAVKEICLEPRGGRFGSSHVVRDLAVTQGAVTPATPDGRLAGTPVASSVAASAGCERTGPTAVLNSVAKLNGPKSWQCAYQANLRFSSGMISEPAQREKLRAMLNVYFQKGGQEIQINVVSSATLRAARKHPEQYRDLVVRVAGFSEFFVNLTPAMQEEVIARAEHF